ncbi:hypothetical protein [Nibribacter koreensis]|uniref:Uncharacterized protein n=1 Tax=Nibribacter koreensis TaxID=1084519 RepID=A0ABP8FNE3_9BACT
MKGLNSKRKVNFIDILLDKIGSEYEPEQVPIFVEPYSKPNNCFLNVEEKVKRDGGNVHYGWTIHKSEILYEGERHAVWESPDGDLIDITPNESSSNQRMFVSDNNFIFDGQLVDNIRVNITDNPLVDDFILLCEKTEKLYTYGKRVDDEQMSVPLPALEVINHFQQLKSLLLDYIYILEEDPIRIAFVGLKLHIEIAMDKI